MKRIIPLSISLTLTGICWIVAAFFCLFYYTLYRHATTELEQNVNSRVEKVEREVGRLASQRHFKPIRARAAISTTDREGNYFFGEPAVSNGEHHLGFSKMGWSITPEFRLPAGSNSLYEFDITVSPSNTRVMDAWVSPADQPENLALFKTLEVYPNEGTNSLRLRVYPKPGVSIKKEFTIVVLRDSGEQ